MRESLRFFTSESVTEGHPDKICDQISDAILDALLASDPDSRVAVETLATKGMVHVVGEVTTEAYVEIPQIVRETILSVGYHSSAQGFDGAQCGVSVSLGQQSPEIFEGVSRSREVREGLGTEEYDRQGAGDQGMMFGYASNETPTLMPMPIHLAHALAERLAFVRHTGLVPYLYPDGKTQVTVGYSGNTPVCLDTVVLSSQHASGIELAALRHDLHEWVIAPVVETAQLEAPSLQTLVNPAGPFVVGGPAADAGLTGRKVMVDTYGGMARHGGGAFSGKDPSKVDRSAAYALRWVAKNLVAAGLADRVEIQAAYAIGQARPVKIYVETFGTERADPVRMAAAVEEIFDLRPQAIIHDLQLARPIYAQTAVYGHFGRESAGFTWEQTDRVGALHSYFDW